MRAHVLVVVCCGWLASSASAQAAGAGSSRPDDARPLQLSQTSEAERPQRLSSQFEYTETVWYGWQTLLADTVSFGCLLVLGASDRLGAGIVVGFLGGLAGAPIIHHAHGNSSAGTISVFGRLTALTLGIAGVIAMVSDEPGRYHRGEALVAIGLASWAAMAIVDAAALSRERVTRHSQTAGTFVVAPWVAPRTASGGVQALLRF
jgi:hypothetical protein